MPVDDYVPALLLEVDCLCKISQLYSPPMRIIGQRLVQAVRRKYYTYMKNQQGGYDRVW